ncbi:hypothetical protein [Nocardia wallacei]|uniref:hypothetical protein n=1 Tax=Nocardia wallacei TaxID=480035 RepID=UPI002453B7AF|nr:hypothetical protein [Nocardia wallacei]
MTDKSKDRAQRPVNPIVAKAAAQVREAKARRRKLPDVPRWDCAGQLSLFAAEERHR